MGDASSHVHILNREQSRNTLIIPDEFREIASLCVAMEDTIGSARQLCIPDHRTLHTGLKVGRDHTTWIKGRVADCGLVEGRDFEVFTETGENPSGGRPAKIYRLSLHAAKQIAMMEGNETGKLVRSYFIWVEENTHRMVDAVRQTVHRRERAPRLPSPTATFREYMRTAKLLGFDTNQAALCANRAAVTVTGVDVLATMGASSLIAPRQEPHLSPTEIGRKLSDLLNGTTLSAQKVNGLLDRHGFQEPDAHGPARWRPTEKGAAFGVWVDVGKATGHGTAVSQLRWREGIVAELVAAMAAGAPAAPTDGRA